MRRILIVLIVALITAVIGCSPAFAQLSGLGSSSPGMGATSPLGLQPGSTVQPTGIAMGATEIFAPGTSPAASPSTSGLMPGSATCSSAASSISQPSTALFDGGGATGAASGTCAGTDSAAVSTPTVPPLQTGRANVPLGSTELNDAGISSVPSVPTMTVSPIVSSTGSAVPCPTTGTSMSSNASSGMSIGSGGC